MPIPLIAVAGYGTAVLISAFIAALHAGKLVVPRVAEWDSPPDVWLHRDLAHLEGSFRKAIAEWEQLGHEFGQVGVLFGEGPGINILPHPIDGAIGRAAVTASFAGEDFEEDEGAPASAPSEDHHEIDAPEGVIRSAVIWLDPVELVDKDAAQVIAHELGHALGYLHCTARLGRKHAEHQHVVLQIPKHGHLMNPVYENGGWGTTGLEEGTLGSARERRKGRRQATGGRRNSADDA